MGTVDSRENDYLDFAYVKENPAVFLISDASFALQCARDALYCGNSQGSAQFARTAILLFAIALEAFINFVYEYSEVPRRKWRNLPLKDKWLRAAQVCLPLHGRIATENEVLYCPGDPVDTFRETEDPFASFLELKRFRDSIVHLKPRFTNVGREEIDTHLERKECYPASRLPKRLKFCEIEHAETALRVFKEMTEELDRQMKGLILPLFEGEAWVETFTKVLKSER